MTWRCMDCDETADRDDNCACDRARILPDRVYALEERIVEMAVTIDALAERLRVLERADFKRRISR